jgi:two-component system, NtrC family, nitrogen regulation sensor histidine kinase GlnL
LRNLWTFGLLGVLSNNVKRPYIDEPTASVSPNMGRPGLSFEDLLQTSCACGVLSIEPGGQITFVSPEAEKMLHLGADKSNIAALPPGLQALVLETQASGHAIADRRIVLDPDRGRSPALSVTVMPAAAREKKLIVLLKDFSSTKKLEHSLRRLDRLASAGTLSAGMAHEIRNAMVAVKTFVDLLLEKNRDAELAEIVGHEMDRMVSMVSQILKFAVPAQPVLARVSVHKILDRTLLLAQHRVEGREIVFERKFQAADDVLEGDAHQLEQAFVNLLLNGVEAIHTSGALGVTTELLADAQLREGDTRRWMRVRIYDTGGGITQDNMGRLFEPFFTTKQNGTGLGLAVTRRIIEEHNGTIQVESQPAKGTTFIVMLPMKG